MSRYPPPGLAYRAMEQRAEAAEREVQRLRKELAEATGLVSELATANVTGLIPRVIRAQEWLARSEPVDD